MTKTYGTDQCADFGFVGGMDYHYSPDTTFGLAPISAGAELYITSRVILIAKFDGEFAPWLPDLCRQRNAALFVVSEGGLD